MRFWIICSAVLLFVCFPAIAEQAATDQSAAESGQMQNPIGGTGPVTPEELAARRAEVTEKAARMLDSFVGSYRGECMVDGKAQIAELVIQPKFMNGHYYQGSYAMKSAAGEPGYEAFTIFSFNSGAMSYLVFYFGNDGYIRNYIGAFVEGEVMIQSPYPTGMEFVRWSLVDEKTLKQETWKPAPGNKAKPEGDPDQTILFKKVQ